MDPTHESAASSAQQKWPAATASRPEVDLSALWDRATPTLYRDNAFRITGMPVAASLREMKKQKARMQMAGGLGLAQTNVPCLPLDPPPTQAQTDAAAYRLQDPLNRLIDELLWFWPDATAEGSDPALEALQANRVSDALAIWVQQDKDPGTPSPVHNLAVLYHAMALDLELRCRQEGWTDDLRKRCDVYWQRALKRWNQLDGDERYWQRVCDRVAELDDPRLTDQTVQSLRAALPRAALQTCARLAQEAVDRGELDQARRHAAILKASGFGQVVLNQAGAEIVKPTIGRLRTLIDSYTPRVEADVYSGLTAAEELADKAQPLLAIVDALVAASDPNAQAVHDDVAQLLLSAAIAHANETKKTTQALPLLERAQQIARGESLRRRIEENLGAARDVASTELCYFCGKRPGVSEYDVTVLMFGNVRERRVGMQKQMTWQNATVYIRRCQTCMQIHHYDRHGDLPYTDEEALEKPSEPDHPITLPLAGSFSFGLLTFILLWIFWGAGEGFLAGAGLSVFILFCTLVWVFTPSYKRAKDKYEQEMAEFRQKDQAFQQKRQARLNELLQIKYAEQVRGERDVSGHPVVRELRTRGFGIGYGPPGR